LFLTVNCTANKDFIRDSRPTFLQHSSAVLHQIIIIIIIIIIAIITFYFFNELFM